MANKHAVVRTDNMYGTDVRTGLVSTKYMGADGTTPTEIENGNIVKIGALIDGEREIYIGTDATSTDDIKDIVLIASPEVVYDERMRNLDDYINAKDYTCRGYRLHTGDIFGVTIEALTGSETPKKGDIVELTNGTKLNVATTATEGSTTVGEIIAIDVVGRYTYYVIEIG